MRELIAAAAAVGIACFFLSHRSGRTSSLFYNVKRNRSWDVNDDDDADDGAFTCPQPLLVSRVSIFFFSRVLCSPYHIVVALQFFFFLNLLLFFFCLVY